MDTGGVENSIDALADIIREEGQLRQEQTECIIEVAREIKTEIANLSGCLNELLWQIRSKNQTGKTCECSKGAA